MIQIPTDICINKLMVFYISVDLEKVSQTVLSFMDNCSKQKGF